MECTANDMNHHFYCAITRCPPLLLFPFSLLKNAVPVSDASQIGPGKEKYVKCMRGNSFFLSNRKIKMCSTHRQTPSERTNLYCYEFSSEKYEQSWKRLPLIARNRERKKLRYGPLIFCPQPNCASLEIAMVHMRRLYAVETGICKNKSGYSNGLILS